MGYAPNKKQCLTCTQFVAGMWYCLAFKQYVTTIPSKCNGYIPRKENKMKRIVAYKTSDGKVFEDKREATRHEHDGIIRDKLREFADVHYVSMTENEFVEYLLMHRDELLTILKGEDHE